MKIGVGIFWVGVVSLMTACGSQPVKTPAQDKTKETTTVEVENTPAYSSTLELRLLAKAEESFRNGYYTEPASNNAYDSFRSVLLINPDNQQARAGLQAILIRYTEQVRNAMAGSRYSLAQSVLREAQQYFPNHKMLDALKEEIRSANPVSRYKQTSLNKPASAKLVVDEFKLPGTLLEARNQEILPLLSQIAERVKENDESVMIYARTDAEGRWIYKQLKDAVPGYRVRGDIRLGREPRIAILPPL